MVEQTNVMTGELERIGKLKEGYERLRREIANVIIGQDEVVRLLSISLFARGHCILIGVPGLAKTLLVKTLARALHWDFKRIQFTPDLMPSDITGTEIIQEDPETGHRRLQFINGPVFANIILADEINRTPPKTQAALLEAMQEYTVTASGKTMSIPKPFFVVATQNPIEQEGTYPLPEAQLDRFMFSISVGYPSLEEEINIVDATTVLREPTVETIFTREDIAGFQDLVRLVPVSRHVTQYAVMLARRSRPGIDGANNFINHYVEWGAGPRASQYLILGAKANALLEGRPAPSILDVRAVAQPVLGHRIIPNYHATGEGITSAAIVNHLLETVEQPKYQ